MSNLIFVAVMVALSAAWGYPLPTIQILAFFGFAVVCDILADRRRR